MQQAFVGSEAAEHLGRQSHEVVGVNNIMRRVFFGHADDTPWNLEPLKSAMKTLTRAPLDVRDSCLKNCPRQAERKQHHRRMPTGRAFRLKISVY